MKFFRLLLANHPLANILFAVVMLLGLVSYVTMPREQDPEINFNWVSITATLPGATAEEVERLIVNPLEDGIKGVADVRFVISNARENVATMLVRFREIDQRTFDKRMNDLRREIQNKHSGELPKEAKEPGIIEITTSNGFPTASLLLLGQADDETLRATGRRIQTDLERLSGVDRVFATGLREPEILVSFRPEALAARGLTASDVADSLAAWYRDVSGGTLKTKEGAWSVSVTGVTLDPQQLEGVPVQAASRPGVTARLSELARIERARATATNYATSDGRPALLFAVTKKSGVNTLQLVERLKDYIARQNPLFAASGLSLAVADDQTVPTREAVGVMETNALFGAVLVFAICWLFLGWKIGVLVTVGIPFSLLGTFAVLAAMGHTINVSVLLGVVIALGILVDDAVVIVESIYYRIARGEDALEAAVAAVREVGAPVIASVATTMAAFLPLMLLPGIVGKFMFIIPFVVALALAISLIEAFWMMPVHVVAWKLKVDTSSRMQVWRERFNRRLRLRYGQALAYVLRRPKRFLVLSAGIVVGAVALLAIDAVRVQFFAFDPLRVLYVNVDMPASASLEETLAEVQSVEKTVRGRLHGIGSEGEARAVYGYAGLKFTENDALYGDPYGQIAISLNPNREGARGVNEVVEQMRADIEALPGAGRKSFTVLSGGPPAGKAISVKVRGDDHAEVQAGADALLGIVRAIPGTRDAQDDHVPGRPQLSFRPDAEALRKAGLSAAQVARQVRLAVDGEVLAFTRDGGAKLEVRVRSGRYPRERPEALLDEPVILPDGRMTRLGALVETEVKSGRGFIRHYNLRRTITVEANLDKTVIDTPAANAQIKDDWEKIRARHPNVDLDFSGELEDIEESLNAMKVLFLLGIGLIYLILATQFVSYWQPLMILVTVPLAFAGVIYGLTLTGNPLSLYTLYGVIALTGIAVNSAIVLIDAANDRMRHGIGTLHAIMEAARRRVVPILITSTTTIGGIFSLAVGLGGQSLLWGPVAGAIVWGLMISTLLTLFVVPLLYLGFMRGWQRPRVPPSTR
ncbi:MAG: efflux RND transporter permease subunit [Accumulibacter sp.]|jgi:multidrug efflux pump subunit AcrB|uniref:efflux RND transporter permease subunit n=1 Tax=Accumulibacter sp. TaxID=2053492 RepID=UPI002FC30A51